MSKHTIQTDSFGQALSTAIGQVKKTEKSWFIIGNTNRVCDETGRKGWEQYPQLEVMSNLEYIHHPANPRKE